MDDNRQFSDNLVSPDTLDMQSGSGNNSEDSNFKQGVLVRKPTVKFDKSLNTKPPKKKFKPDKNADSEVAAQVECQLHSHFEHEVESNVKQEVDAKVKHEVDTLDEYEVEAQVKQEVEAQVDQEFEAQVEQEIEARVEHEVEVQVKLEVEDHVEHEVEVQVKLEVEDHVEHEVDSRVEHEVDSRIEHEVEAQVKHEAEAQVEHEAEAQDEHETEAQIEHEAESQVEHEVEAQVEYEFVTQIEHEIDPQVEQEVNPQIGQEINAQIEREVDQLVEWISEEEDNAPTTKECSKGTKSVPPKIIELKKTRFKCRFCKKRFILKDNIYKPLIQKSKIIEKIREKLKLHEESNHPHMCRICRESFASKTQRAKHRKLHIVKKVKKTDKIKCQFCDQWISPSWFARHLKKEHKNRKKFTCSVCSLVLETPSELVEHYGWHNAINIGASTSSMQTSLTQHLGHDRESDNQSCTSGTQTTNTQSAIRSQCECEFCGKVFSHKYRRITHYVSQHLRPSDLTPGQTSNTQPFLSETQTANEESTSLQEDKISFECQLCEETFPSESQRIHHFVIEHLGLQDLIQRDDSDTQPCSDITTSCVESKSGAQTSNDRSARSQTSDVESTSTQEDKISYKCDLCDETFNSESMRIYHFVTRHLILQNLNQSQEYDIHPCTSAATTTNVESKSDTQTSNAESTSKKRIGNAESKNKQVGKKGFKCQFCGKPFPNKKLWVNHYVTQHLGIQDPESPLLIRSKKSDTQPSTSGTQAIDTDTTSRSQTCNTESTCSSVESTNRSQTCSVQSIKKRRFRKAYKCEFCGEAFPNKKLRINHYVVQHFKNQDSELSLPNQSDKSNAQPSISGTQTNNSDTTSGSQSCNIESTCVSVEPKGRSQANTESTSKSQICSVQSTEKRKIKNYYNCEFCGEAFPNKKLRINHYVTQHLRNKDPESSLPNPSQKSDTQPCISGTQASTIDTKSRIQTDNMESTCNSAESTSRTNISVESTSRRQTVIVESNITKTENTDIVSSNSEKLTKDTA